MTQGMEAFAKQYRIAMDDPHLRDLYQQTLTAARDNAAREAYVRQEGIEEGIDIGIEKGIDIGDERRSEKVARRMLAIGMPIDQIVEMTDLSIERIQSLSLTKN